MLSVDILAEMRGWLTLTLGTIAGFIGIRTYLASQKQRRLENSFRLISMFRESLKDGDMQAWEEVFHATSEPAGAKEGFFINIIDGKRIERPIADLFSEGPSDNGAIERMAELLDLISDKMLNEKLDNRLIYFQLGQLMDTIYLWLSKIDIPNENATCLEKHFPSFDRLYKKKLIDERWVYRTYSHIG